MESRKMALMSRVENRLVDTAGDGEVKQTEKVAFTYYQV